MGSSQADRVVWNQQSASKGNHLLLDNQQDNFAQRKRVGFQLLNWVSNLACAIIVSRVNGLLLGAPGDQQEAGLFSFAVHELMLKSGM